MGVRLTSFPGLTDDVHAVVLTHLRPRLASAVVRSLLDVEGLAPTQVTVVVNGEGGLDDPELEASVRMVRLPTNTGPAGGFRAGLLAAYEDPSVHWIYLCEDDVGLFDLPVPRLAELRARIKTRSAGPPIGAVVAYGRRFVGGGGHTVNYVPDVATTHHLEPVDVACWGATLVARDVVRAGVLPDPSWFFGYEDFDFFCRVRDAGYSVLVDGAAARHVAGQQTLPGRDEAFARDRPTDADESWRAFYVARNFFALARRHGHPRWQLAHLAYSVRRLQLAHSTDERLAILRGLWDGVRGRLGYHPHYRRQIGELPADDQG